MSSSSSPILLCLLTPDDEEATRIAHLAESSAKWSVLRIEERAHFAALLHGEDELPKAPFAAIASTACECIRELDDFSSNPPLVLIAEESDTIERIANLPVTVILHRPWTDDEMASVLERVARAARAYSAWIEFERRYLTLTNREREMLDGLLSGLSTKSVAQELGIAAKTAHAHRSNILTKFERASLEEVFALRLNGLGR